MLGLLAGLFAILPGRQQTPTMGTMQLVFMRKTNSKPRLSKEEREKFQREHQDGLRQLWESGRAVTVGRLDDSSYAELVLLNTKDPAEATEWLKNDPYINSGMLTLDILPWYFQNVFQKAPNFNDVEKIWFGILQRPRNAPQYSATKLEELQSGHMSNIQKMANDGILAAAGPLLSKEDRRGIFVFFAKDLAKIKRSVAVDPLIQAKLLELKLMPWWTGKGTVVQYKPK